MRTTIRSFAPGETLDEPGIYDLHRGERDRSLKRREDLEGKVPAGGRL